MSNFLIHTYIQNFSCSVYYNNNLKCCNPSKSVFRQEETFVVLYVCLIQFIETLFETYQQWIVPHLSQSYRKRCCKYIEHVCCVGLVHIVNATYGPIYRAIYIQGCPIRIVHLMLFTLTIEDHFPTVSVFKSHITAHKAQVWQNQNRKTHSFV